MNDELSSLDRIILIALILGVWAWLIVSALSAGASNDVPRIPLDTLSNQEQDSLKRADHPLTANDGLPRLAAI